MTNEKKSCRVVEPFLTVDRIAASLRRPLPGRPAQILMAPVPRPLDPPADGPPPRRAGVLLLLYPAHEGGGLLLALTRRTESVADHKGQVSFPGGAVDPGDASTAATALRETCEEIGIRGDDVQLLGALTPVYIAPSHFLVYPHVACLPYRPTFIAQPREVTEILEIPVEHFLDERLRSVEERIIRGESTRVPYFSLLGHKVWGATAVVLVEFAVLLRDAQG
jgi:8-oxo-dGTP pyrophosphatase MutT (NUDIX family)